MSKHQVINIKIQFNNLSMHNFFQRHKFIEGEYDINQIEVEYQLGRGNSYVYSIIIEGNRYAMKQIQIKSNNEYDNFKRELNLMKDLCKNCDGMIKYEGYFVTIMEMNQYQKLKYAFIVMQCAQINLEQLINQRRQKGKRLKQWQLQKIIQFMIDTFLKLQQLSIAHCDIKPQNILLLNYQKMTMKLCDVGSCKIISKQNAQQATILGTVPFLAPQLIVLNSKSNKIVSTNPFKCDVFSFGLVVLYMITFKKFKSNERVDIEEQTYMQIINEWMKQVKQLGGAEICAVQVLKQALEFRQEKRPLFKEIRKIYTAEKKKRQEEIMKDRDQLQQSQVKSPTIQLESAKSYNSTTPNILTKSRGLKKTSAKTNVNGFRFREKQRQINSPLMKRKTSSFSPEKSTSSITQFKKIIYINQETKETLPYESFNSDDKIFVLNLPIVNFKKAETVVMLKNCDLSVVNQLKNINGKSLYIDYYGLQGVGLLEDAPYLNFQKISVNLCQASLVGGYRGIFKMISGPSVNNLQVKLTGSDVCYDEVQYLFDRLSNSEVTSFLFCWQKIHLKQQEHYNLTEKISKINLKKLTMLMNEDFIQSQKQIRWLLPKGLQYLSLDYDRNFLTKLMSNLSISISQLKLKELYLSIQANNLGKGQLNMLFKAIHSIETLQKLMLNISRNKLQDLKYISNVLLQNNPANINSLELKMHHIEASTDKIIQLIDTIKQLFQFQLKILKISCNRNMKKSIFQQKIEQIIPNNKIKIDLVGIDNQYFTVYLKKKQKKAVQNFNSTMDSIINKGIKDLKIQYHSKGVQKASGSKNKKQFISPSKINLVPKQMGSSPSIPLNNYQNNIVQHGICSSLYKCDLTFDNYQCLTCAEYSQLPKYTFYCKWCVENCSHKGHNIVKIFARTRCSCAYSGCCLSDIKYRICAQDLGIKFKKQYQCYKCQQFLCMSCVELCKSEHSKWIQQTNGMRFFECTGRRGGVAKLNYESLRSIK